MLSYKSDAYTDSIGGKEGASQKVIHSMFFICNDLSLSSTYILYTHFHLCQKMSYFISLHHLISFVVVSLL